MELDASKQKLQRNQILKIDNKSMMVFLLLFRLIQIFDGNKDGSTISCCELPYHLVVRYLRFKPVSWDSKICLRIGVFGIGNVTGKYQYQKAKEHNTTKVNLRK